MRYHTKPPPTTDEKLAAWETAFSVEMPDDLKALLRESDGPVLFEDGTQKELQFLSASEAVAYYEEYMFCKLCPDAVPISMDGCGNFVVYRVAGRGIDGIHAMSAGNLGWEDSVCLCSDLESLIAMEERVEQRLVR